MYVLNTLIAINTTAINAANNKPISYLFNLEMIVIDKVDKYAIWTRKAVNNPVLLLDVLSSLYAKLFIGLSATKYDQRRTGIAVDASAINRNSKNTVRHHTKKPK